MPELELLCVEESLDVLCVCEHWLADEEITHYSNLADLKMVSHFSRHSSRGGVAIYLKDMPGISVNSLDLSKYCEEIHCELTGITIPELSLVVVAMYRSPNGSVDRFFELLELCLMYLLKLGLQIVVGTDHNINLLNSSRDSSEFLNLLRGFNMYSTVIEPTRCMASLDSFLTNISLGNYDVSVSEDQIADHKHILLSVKCRHANRQSQVPAKRVSYRSFNEKAIQDFYNSLSIEVSEIIDVVKALPANDGFMLFFNMLSEQYNIYFPIKTKLCKTNKPRFKRKEWYTPELAQMRSYILLLSDLSKVRPNLRPILSNLRREYRCGLKSAKQTANATNITRSGNPCKAAWNLINKSKAPGTLINYDFATADDFNNFFVKSIDEIVDSVQVKDHSNSLQSVPNVAWRFSWKVVSSVDVVKAINRFKATSSKDVYEMTPIILKRVACVLGPVLSHLFNKCTCEGVFPDILKVVRTVPIYKKGLRGDVANYRAISVIPVIAKVFETLMFDQLYDYFESHHLLVPAQYGFRRGKSTVLAVETLLQNILCSFETKQSTAVLLCDLSRAFDCISHKILLLKLSKYGVGDGALKVVKSYLTDRKQIVNWNGASSDPKIVKHGVPQGSVLGPLLFLIAINDLYYSVSGKAVMFADDTTLYSCDRYPRLAQLAVHEMLKLASTWFETNGLLLNSTKTQEIVFSLAKDSPLYDSVKLLGFVLDRTLVWDDHVDHTCKKLSRVIYLLRRLASELPRNYLRQAFFAFFQSHVSYGIRLWGHATSVGRILLLQKKAIRIISDAKFRDHCKPLFVQNRVLTVVNLYIYHCLLEIKDNIAILPANNSVHTHGTRNSEDLYLSRYRLSKSLNCFPVTGTKFFNELPGKVRGLPTSKFKTVVKDWLCNNPFYSYKEYFEADLSTI